MSFSFIDNQNNNLNPRRSLNSSSCDNQNDNSNTSYYHTQTKNKPLQHSNKNSSGQKKERTLTKCEKKKDNNCSNLHKTPQSITSSRAKKALAGDRFIPVRNTNDNENIQYMLLKSKFTEDQFQQNNIYNMRANMNDNNNNNNNNPIEVNESVSANQNTNASITRTTSLLNNFMLDSLLPKCNDSFSVDRGQIRLVNESRDRILSFKCQQASSTKKTAMPFLTHMKTFFENKNHYSENLQAKKCSNYREICQTPERILDAPQLVDDYYLNLIDWNIQNILCVALGNTVYLWNGQTAETLQLMTAKDNICSVNWMNNGNCLAIGLHEGAVELWDTAKQQQMRTMYGHSARVCSLNWNSYLLSSGSKDSRIIDHDVRMRESSVHTFKGHTQEVCALRWNSDGISLASGGNDNLLLIWDIRSVNSQQRDSIWSIVEGQSSSSLSMTTTPEISPRYSFIHHQSAVKAIAWCPWQKGLLASGGGTKDKTIKFWNTDTGSLINSIDTGSQVCALMWNKHEKELISSHGYSKNQIAIWQYPKMVKIVELLGHMSRVLYISMSPDGCTIVSGSGDETLRFWVINEKKAKSECSNDFIKTSSQKILNSFQVR